VQSASGRAIDVFHYDARVEPDLATKTVKGEVVLSLAVVATDARDTIELDTTKVHTFCTSCGKPVGERGFWAGIRHYTRSHVGEAVTTEDFQAAMEHASRRSLSDFFDRWVYAR
jgi:aminopeptidase N